MVLRIPATRLDPKIERAMARRASVRPRLAEFRAKPTHAAARVAVQVRLPDQFQCELYLARRGLRRSDQTCAGGGVRMLVEDNEIIDRRAGCDGPGERSAGDLRLHSK